ncbi:hypothetical protein LVD15_12505 [Fulvivirga maritima]|uniref:hypothetical protein n=1 Tax=Fulvivirga maritima TaxID=2904247 RepID=UPI001F217262|nr:hypothetical protein [Fulvivirga maritima]UII29207.1 hypothetical protein LVD15_12505 [Fulvivirga maritima]
MTEQDGKASQNSRQTLLKNSIELLPMEGLENTNFLLEEQQLYFWLEKGDQDPLEKKCYFVHCTDIKNRYYFVSKPVALKKLNKYLIKDFEGEQMFMSEVSSGLKKISKKKNTFEPVHVSEIAKILSGKDFEELQNQEEERMLAYRSDEFDFEANLHIHANYATIWFNDSLIFNFYDDQEAWLKLADKQLKKFELSPHDTASDRQKEEVKNALAKLDNSQQEYNRKRDLLINHPELSQLLLNGDFSSHFDNFRAGKFEIIDNDVNEEGDFTLLNSQCLIINGNLNVKGSLLMKEGPKTGLIFNDGQVIVTGNVTAENLIISAILTPLFIAGKTTVTNILIDSHHIHAAVPPHAHILLHQHKPNNKNKRYTYDKEATPYNGYIFDESIYQEAKYGSSYEYKPDLILDKIKKGEQFLDFDQQVEIDLTPLKINAFIDMMTYWEGYYGSLAGFEKLDGIYEDHQIKEGDIYPGAGDWVVVDRRSNTGTYGYSHDGGGISSVIIKSPKKHGVNYKEEPIEGKVAPITLLERYQWISDLFIDWLHRTTPSPFGHFEDADDINKSYEEEKSEFPTDPHLALYWLLHFGFSLDKRYDEVAAIVKEHQLDDEMYHIYDTLIFFENTDAFYDIEIKKSEEAKEIFLRRRAFLVFFTQSQSYRGGSDNLQNWWNSIIMYPKVEDNLITRMRWLKNNLKKYNQWNEFEALVKDDQKDICLLSYVYACNPNTEDKASYADKLVNELFTYKNVWKDEHKRKFAEIMLWDVRDFVSDKEALKTTAAFYFNGNEVSKEYQDILAVLGEQNENVAALREHIAAIDQFIEGYDRFKTPAEEKAKIQKNIFNYLDGLTPEIRLETLMNLKGRDLQRMCFVYLWRADIENKKEALLHLFVNSDFSAHDINEKLFGEDFPNFIKGEDDPNLEMAKALFEVAPNLFDSDYPWENSIKSAAVFFLTSAHLPSVYDYFMEKVMAPLTPAGYKKKQVIFSSIYTTQYDTKINPSLNFSKEQIEGVLEAMIKLFLRDGGNSDAERVIFYCQNPEAEEWIRARMNDKTWMKQFASIQTAYDPLDEELESCFESALEFIEEEKSK